MLLRWFLLLLPLSYSAVLLGSLVHEVAGNGLAALLLGGTFSGFLINPWGGGICFCEAPGYELHISVAGAASEAVAGLLLLALVRWRSRGSIGRVVLLVISARFLANAFFSVLLGGLPGFEETDFSKVALRLEDPRSGPIFTVAGALGFIATIIALGSAVTREVSYSFDPETRPRGLLKAGILLVCVVLPGFECVLNWGMALSLGVQPHTWLFLAEVSCHAIVAVYLFLRRMEPAPGVPGGPPGAWSLAAAWCSALVLLACSVYWWSEFGWWVY